MIWQWYKNLIIGELWRWQSRVVDAKQPCGGGRLFGPYQLEVMPRAARGLQAQRGDLLTIPRPDGNHTCRSWSASYRTVYSHNLRILSAQKIWWAPSAAVQSDQRWVGVRDKSEVVGDERWDGQRRLTQQLGVDLFFYFLQRFRQLRLFSPTVMLS